MISLSEQQRLFLVESTQLYEAWREAFQHVQNHKYGMKWQKSSGSDYLIRLSDARGNGKSLGPRSADTESIFVAFNEGKGRAEQRYKALSERLQQQARLNKALRLGRMPVIVGEILRALDKTKARDDFRMVGTHALFAYEAMAGVQFRMELLASGDVDLLYDPRKKLSIVAESLDGRGLVGLLKKVDKSFDLMKKSAFRAVNDQGFMVDLIVPVQEMHKTSVQFARDDLVAAEVPSLQWLANAPAIECIVIASDGMPVRTRVPDPRAFAIHKSWLSQQPERDPVKKVRDMAQSRELFALLREFLPNYPLDVKQMRYFPKSVLENEMPDNLPPNRSSRDDGGMAS